jgi:predicted nucleic acid-binding protein
MGTGYLLDSNVIIGYLAGAIPAPGMGAVSGIIAATALTENFVLVTRNTDDFKNIAGLELLNPWELPAPPL